MKSLLGFRGRHFDSFLGCECACMLQAHSFPRDAVFPKEPNRWWALSCNTAVSERSESRGSFRAKRDSRVKAIQVALLVRNKPMPRTDHGGDSPVERSAPRQVVETTRTGGREIWASCRRLFSPGQWGLPAGSGREPSSMRGRRQSFGVGVVQQPEWSGRSG